METYITKGWTKIQCETLHPGNTYVTETSMGDKIEVVDGIPLGGMMLSTDEYLWDGQWRKVPNVAIGESSPMCISAGVWNFALHMRRPK